MYTSRKMFPRHNHPNNQNIPNINNNNAKFGSWRTLSRSRSYFSRAETTDTTDSESSEDKRRKGFWQTWIYAGIALLYLLIIGIVITVLVLAPRYPSYYYYPVSNPGIQKPIVVGINGPKPEVVQSVSSQIEIQPAPPGKPFMPSPRDPIFHVEDMDPRSDLEIINDDNTRSRSGIENIDMIGTNEEANTRGNNATAVLAVPTRINNRFFNFSNDPQLVK